MLTFNRKVREEGERIAMNKGSKLNLSDSSG